MVEEGEEESSERTEVPPLTTHVFDDSDEDDEPDHVRRGREEHDQEDEPTRHPLGIGSRFGRSQDGQLDSQPARETKPLAVIPHMERALQEADFAAGRLSSFAKMRRQVELATEGDQPPQGLDPAAASSQQQSALNSRYPIGLPRPAIGGAAGTSADSPESLRSIPASQLGGRLPTVSSLASSMEAPELRRLASSSPPPQATARESIIGRKSVGSADRVASEKERALLAQINDLEKQLAKEKYRKKELAKASSSGGLEVRRRLLVATQWLPYQMEPKPDGTFDVGAPSDYLDAYDALRRLDVTWVGLCGNFVVPPAARADLRERLSRLNCVPVFLEAEQLVHAEAIANEVLWPLFHYIPLSMLDADIDMIHERWEGYRELNKAFASEIVRTVTPNDLVWAHDYYLMLLPQMLREAHPKLKIGWYLHTPFPSAEIYVTLPMRKEILRGVLAANLIGFQTYDYVRHFMFACSSVLGTDVNVESTYILDAHNRTAVTVEAFPAGIDFSRYDAMLQTAELKDKVIELQRRFDGKLLLLGVDRMDYIKGIPHKLIAVEKMLNQHPSWASRIQMVQIATPPRGDPDRYQKLKNKVHKLVGRVNGRFGSLEHTPIQYLDQPVSACELCALFYLADLLLVTSLREGMSHTSFEFIACQRRNHGVLLLSEFAGAAQTLGSGALLCNPFNTDEVARTIFHALHMPEAEREDRHHNMYEYVHKFTMQFWVDDFVAELRTTDAEEELPTLALPSPLPRAEMLERYAASSRRLIVLGLLGTLIDYCSFKSMEALPYALWKDLLTLSSDPRNTVVVITCRERALVSQWLGDLPVWIAAEGGVYYRLGGRAAEWQSPFETFDDSWIASIKPVFKYFEERTPGSVTETQEHTITWHYREADEDFGEIQAADLQKHLERVLSNHPVEVCLDWKQVQVRPYGVSKGATLDIIIEGCTDYSRAPLRDVEMEAITPRDSLNGDERVSLGGLLDNAPHVPLPPISYAETDAPAEGCKIDFVLSLGSLSMRDEDMFGDLLAKEAVRRGDRSIEEPPYADFLPDADGVWTCRVGKQSSQARYFVEDEREVAKMVAALASQSVSTAAPTEPPSQPLSPTSLSARQSFGGSVRFSCDEGGQSALYMTHNALAKLGVIEAAIDRCQQLAFFLDYDGTLTPIVENPSEAMLSEEARAVVRALAWRYPTAIVSGRARATAQGLVRVENLYYAGSHGMDILGPRGASFQVSDSFRPALEEAAAKVSEALSNVQGVIVEDNNFSVSVHYRMVVEEAERAKVAQAVEDVVASMPMLRRATGKMVYEMRPSADWHKGKAVEWLLERIRKENEGSVFPVYIGDDVTDEDAFSVMHDLGGIAIIVSDSATAENTAASYALQSPAEVVAFLDHFAHRGSERELFALQSQALHDLEQCVGASLPTPTSVHAPPPPSLPSPVEVAEACFADGDRFANVVHR